jgi:hypothetical protein
MPYGGGDKTLLTTRLASKPGASSVDSAGSCIISAFAEDPNHPRVVAAAVVVRKDVTCRLLTPRSSLGDWCDNAKRSVSRIVLTFATPWKANVTEEMTDNSDKRKRVRIVVVFNADSVCSKGLTATQETRRCVIAKCDL